MFAFVAFVAIQYFFALLQKLKPNRTVILTSQFMNEAESLADRIAIMNQGLIVANGSSDFLKKTFGKYPYPRRLIILK